MTYLLILDNGEQYSDHSHQPILACATEAEAIAAKEQWDAWHRPCKAMKAGLFMAWIDANPPPFGPPHRGWYYSENDSVAVMPVPDWANTPPITTPNKPPMTDYTESPRSASCPTHSGSSTGP